MTTPDLALVLTAYYALSIPLGPIAALVVSAFITGLLLGQHRQPKP